MERFDAMTKVFNDLKIRVNALPRLRGAAQMKETDNIMTIINVIEKSFQTHIASDFSEEDNRGLIEKAILDMASGNSEKYSGITLKDVPKIQEYLLRNYRISITHQALLNRIKHYLDQSL